MTKGIYSDLQPCEVNVNSSRYPDWSAEEGVGSRDGGLGCQALFVSFPLLMQSFVGLSLLCIVIISV